MAPGGRGQMKQLKRWGAGDKGKLFKLFRREEAPYNGRNGKEVTEQEILRVKESDPRWAGEMNMLMKNFKKNYLGCVAEFLDANPSLRPTENTCNNEEEGSVEGDDDEDDNEDEEDDNGDTGFIPESEASVLVCELGFAVCLVSIQSLLLSLSLSPSLCLRCILYLHDIPQHQSFWLAQAIQVPIHRHRFANLQPKPPPPLTIFLVDSKGQLCQARPLLLSLQCANRLFKATLRSIARRIWCQPISYYTNLPRLKKMT